MVPSTEEPESATCQSAKHQHMTLRWSGRNTNSSPVQEIVHVSLMVRKLKLELRLPFKKEQG